MKLAFRKYLGRDLIEQRIVEADDIDLAALAEQHALGMLTGGYDSLEVEFLDDPPDSKTRFFRIGKNPIRMRDPITFEPDIDAEAREKLLRRWGHEPSAREKLRHRGKFK